MAISAALVKELRERTGAGMMECKRALVEADGDIDAAIEAMRKSDQAKAVKKAGRIAADGTIELRVSDDGRRGVLVEINSETDFVAKHSSFAEFAGAVADRALGSDVGDIDALLAMPLKTGEDRSIDVAREAVISKVGENIQIRRLVRFDDVEGDLHHYRHGTRIAVLVEMTGGDAVLGKDIAMHIAASNPLCISAEDIPTETLDKEREIFRAQALGSGKPEQIVDKITEGRMRKYLEEVTLHGQAFVKDTEQSVEKLLKQAGASVIRFARLEVGEGIEKKAENFAEEVAAQARGA